MNKILLIIQREYFSRVKKKSFIWMTILVPTLFIGMYAFLGYLLANVDERSYVPASDKTMGDHPVIWTNPAYKAKNVYIFMGHSPDLFDNAAYTTLFKNAIFWAAGKQKS